MIRGHIRGVAGPEAECFKVCPDARTGYELKMRILEKFESMNFVGGWNMAQEYAPLLMLPGLLCDRRIWTSQMARFAQFDPVAIDGYGDARSMEAMAQRVLAQAPARFSLVGHSMGARVAFEIYRAAPERVARLALLSTGVHAPAPGEAEKRHALLQVGREQGIDKLLDLWLPPMVGTRNRSDQHLMASLREMCRTGGVAQFEAQIEALLSRPEVENLLPSIACPTLVAVGRDDEWSPVKQHRAIAAGIPHAELTIFENCGHMCPAEAPDQVNAALEAWLERE
jgi:pimeloyl-ACP methyl ester carboxylesterase